MKRKLWFALLALFVCAVLTAVSALLTCPKCGYEYVEGTLKCTHCGADLPKVPAKIATEPVKVVKPTWAIAADEDWRKSSDAATEKKLWLAWFYARNAYTLNMMTEGTNSTRAAKLVSLMEGYEKRLSTSAVTCPLCKGTGHADVHIKSSNGRDLVMHSDTVNCKFCEGAGTLAIFVRADLLNHDRAQVKRDYDALQKDRGWSGLSGLWLPEDLTKDLTLKERVQLMRTLGSPCLDCAGLGRLACVKCDGAGWTKCSNAECDGGYVPCPDCGGTGKPNQKAATAANAGNRSGSGKYVSLGSFCQTCNGTGHSLCRVCKGAAHLACQTCNGKAIQVCKTCNGTGQNAVCGQCKGDGTMLCSRCRGAGKIRNAICTECNGEGQILCPTCKGVGKVARR
jgi:DnaJ-class molecular chaperone